jgi:phosphoribosylformylglycinamidine synthase subunit PurSL
MELNLKKLPAKYVERNDFALFSESNSRFIVEVAQKDKEIFETIMKGKVCAKIGKVTKNPSLTIKSLKGTTVVDASVADLRASWKRTLSSGA